MINTIDGKSVMNKAVTQIQAPPLGIELPFWKRLSEFIGGLRLYEFTIFCGATGSGKTQWLAALVAQLIASGTKCFVAPVETGATDFGIRILSVLTQYDFNTGAALKSHDLAKRLLNTVDTHANAFEKNLFFSSHDNRVDVLEMVETLHYMSEVKGVQVAVLDNLNFFLKPTGQNNIVMEFDEAIHQFVMLAKKIPMHIILVMHPKKTDNGKIKSEFDIKGSSTAVQEASNVLLMNRLSDDDIKAKIGSSLTREFVFCKIRKRGFNVGKKFYMSYQGVPMLSDGMSVGEVLEHEHDSSAFYIKNDCEISLMAGYCIQCGFQNKKRLSIHAMTEDQKIAYDMYKTINGDVKHETRTMLPKKVQGHWGVLCKNCHSLPNAENSLIAPWNDEVLE